MKIPILNGITADNAADFRESFPVNLEPVLIDSGISKGYLRAAPGVTQIATGPGPDRGAINWQGVGYRVMGGSLVRVSTDSVATLGSIAGSGPVSMDYSFDRLAICAGGGLYYWTDSLVQVTDPDLGSVIDVLWIDGYFMLTDGEFLIVTELNDPMQIDPIKYGSSEEDPDPIVALRKVRGEVYAVNRYTIENFQNVGGNGFPFARNSGGLIPKGAVGTHAVAYFSETFAFVGGGRNEAVSVYLAGAGQALSISTPQVDRELASLSDGDQALIELEAKVENNEEWLYVHLPDKTLVYMANASQAAGEPVWYVLAGGADGLDPYPLRHLSLVNGQWVGGDSAGRIGTLDRQIETVFGSVVGWRFDTRLVFNDARGGIIRSLELVGLPGRAPFGSSPTCFLSMTTDGQTYGQEFAISMGGFGQRGQRVQWRPRKRFSNYVGLRFRGANTAIASWASLEADIEGLAA